jgi:D-serine deaminase-like pyridoxal phosphate-dependent protein
LCHIRAVLASTGEKSGFCSLEALASARILTRIKLGQENRIMDSRYHVQDTSTIFSPALLFYRELIEQNIRRMIQIAGTPERLRPHVKTHKTREIVRLELDAGITRHKCATLAEAEMLAECGVADVLLAYPMVGPNCSRLALLAERYLGTRFSVLADHPLGVQQLSDALKNSGTTVEVLLDLDTGQHRTGIVPGGPALELYESLTRLPGIRPGGLHVYDGHNHQEDPAQRAAAAHEQFQPVLQFREALLRKGLPLPRIVAGGTPTFPIYARMELPGLECAPGTCVLHDHGYGTRFADLGFTPAALVLTRVISRPTQDRVTFDLGYKAVASDPPAGSRCVLLDVPDAKPVLQNEEHLVIECPGASRYRPGDEAYALPTHICPTCAMHRQAYVIDQGQLVDRWDIVARDRILQI